MKPHRLGAPGQLRQRPFARPDPFLPPYLARNDRDFLEVQKQVQSYFGPDKSNGREVDGQRQVTPSAWDDIIARAQRDGGIGPKELGLMFNALNSMVLGRRVGLDEGKRVLGKIAPALDDMNHWESGEQLAVLEQLERAGRTTPQLGVLTAKVTDTRRFGAELATAAAAVRGLGTLDDFAADYNASNGPPWVSSHLMKLGRPAVTVEAVRVAGRLVGHVLRTTTPVSCPPIGSVGSISTATWLGPDGQLLSRVVRPSPDRLDRWAR